MTKPELQADNIRSELNLAIIDMTRDGWDDKLRQALVNDGYQPPVVGSYRGDTSLQAIFDLVSDMNASTAVVEPYISQDWIDEYGAHYSGTFRNPHGFPRRIHFFASLPNGNRLTIDEIIRIPEGLRRRYLGYTVIRPIPAFRVGDTVLTSPCSNQEPNHGEKVHCIASYRVHLLGNELTVVGMPFFQQETFVGVCAEADLWMVARYLNKLGETRRYHPSEITRLATLHTTIGPPRDGLTDIQMIDALRGMDLNPVCHYPDSPGSAIEFIYSSIESGLPVIAGIPGHVVVIIGHDYTDTLSLSTADTSLSGAVKSFIAHDDASGPYQTMEIGQITELIHRSDGTTKGVRLLTLDEQPVDFCLTALPPYVTLTWRDVIRNTDTWLKVIREYVSEDMDIPQEELWNEDEVENLLYRIYLRRSWEFKQDVDRPDQSLRRHPYVVMKYQCMLLPRYVWVVEFYDPSEIEGVNPVKRLASGEIVFDATSIRHTPEDGMIAFTLNGISYFPRRVVDGITVKSSLAVSEDNRFTPLIRRRCVL